MANRRKLTGKKKVDLVFSHDTLNEILAGFLPRFLEDITHIRSRGNRIAQYVGEIEEALPKLYQFLNNSEEKTLTLPAVFSSMFFAYITKKRYMARRENLCHVRRLHENLYLISFKAPAVMPFVNHKQDSWNG